MFKKAQEKTDAVSPVIGVILLVAVTVALVALATVIVFDIGSDVSDTADATVQLEQQGSDMTATVSRNENVDGFTLQGNVDDGTTASASFGATAGSVGTLAITQSSETGDIVANVSNGTDIQSIDLYEASDKSSPVETITGNNSASQTETFSGYTTGDYVIGVTDSGTEKQITNFTHEKIQTTVSFDYSASTKGSITDSGTVLGTNDLTSVSVIAALEDGSEEVLISTDVSK